MTMTTRQIETFAEEIDLPFPDFDFVCEQVEIWGVEDVRERLFDGADGTQRYARSELEAKCLFYKVVDAESSSDLCYAAVRAKELLEANPRAFVLERLADELLRKITEVCK